MVGTRQRRAGPTRGLYKVRPKNSLFTDYTKLTETQDTMRGICPSLCCSCLTHARHTPSLLCQIRRDKEGHTPPCRVILISTWWGGACPLLVISCMVGSGTPSLLCLHSNFDTVRKGRPSSSCHCRFNAVRRAYPFLSCRCSHYLHVLSMRWEG